jgi:asparagine synthase (glutamine-hydrolysing)
MCGIAGAFGFDPDTRVPDAIIIARLNELQRRRGPDGEGIWSSSDRSVSFGHRRLAIIDTGRTAHNRCRSAQSDQRISQAVAFRGGH